MNVLVGFECSQEVCKAFRERGHEAYSCDTQEAYGGHPEWHFHCDIYEGMAKRKRWDLIILHPECIKVCVSGNKHYGFGKPKHGERLWAVSFTLQVWNRAKEISDMVALENPVGTLNKYTMMPTPKYIQPHNFGHSEFKKTGLWLHNLPPLIPSNQLQIPEKGTAEYKKWERVFRMPPSPDRSKMRSKTYSGIARAMAEQWGKQ